MTDQEATIGQLRADHAQAKAAMDKGYREALDAANYWRETAANLTQIHASGIRLPLLPDEEEWWETRRPYIPFGSEELSGDIRSLSGLITKAHTLANVYAEQLVHLSSLRAGHAAALAELDGRPRTTGEEEEEPETLMEALDTVVHRLLAEQPYTAEQIAAAERVMAAYDTLHELRAAEPSPDEDWDAWNDAFQAADTARIAADRAYAATFASGVRVPDSRTVLGR